MTPQRNNKGQFAKGNTIGFTTNTEKARLAGSIGGSVSKINRAERFIELVNAKPLTREEMEQIDAALLTMTCGELERIINDPQQPVYAVNRAKQLNNDKTSLAATEKILDRLFGKPSQMQPDEGAGGDNSIHVHFEEVDEYFRKRKEGENVL